MNNEGAPSRIVAMKLSTNLKHFLKNEELTLSSLAKELGLPKSTIHGWINGVEPKSLLELKRLSEFIGVGLDQLCFGDVDAKFRHTNIKVTIAGVEYELVLKHANKV